MKNIVCIIFILMTFIVGGCGRPTVPSSKVVLQEMTFTADKILHQGERYPISIYKPTEIHINGKIDGHSGTFLGFAEFFEFYNLKKASFEYVADYAFSRPALEKALLDHTITSESDAQYVIHRAILTATKTIFLRTDSKLIESVRNIDERDKVFYALSQKIEEQANFDLKGMATISKLFISPTLKVCSKQKEG